MQATSSTKLASVPYSLAEESKEPENTNQTLLLPRYHSELPYLPEEYKCLSSNQKTPLFDFLFEGKIPGKFPVFPYEQTSNNLEKSKSANSEIVNWCLQNNEIEALDFLVEKTNKLGLRIDTCQSTEHLVPVLSKILELHPDLKIDISQFSFDPKIYPFLIDLVSSSKIECLKVNAASASEADLLKLFKALDRNLSLKNAVFSNCNMTEDAEVAFGQFVAAGCNLMSLRLENSSLGPAAGANFFHALAGNKNLKHLYLYQVIFSTDDKNGLSFALANNQSIQKLDVECTSFGHQGLKTILDGARKSASLDSLRLFAQKISTDNAEILTEYISLNRPQTELIVTCTSFNSQQIRNLEEALKKNKSLCKLRWGDAFICSFELGQPDFWGIANLLRQNEIMRNGKIFNHAARIFTESSARSGVYLPDGPAQMVFRNIWQLSNDHASFDETQNRVATVINEIRQEAETETEGGEALLPDTSDTDAMRASSSSSGRQKPKNT